MADTSARGRRAGSGGGRLLVLALLSLLTSGTSGCATKGDLRDVQTDLRSVDARLGSLVEEIERQNRMSLDTLSQQRSQIVDFQGTVMNQLQEIRRELSEIRNLTGANASRIGQIDDQLAEIRYAMRTGAPVGRGGTSGARGGETGAGGEVGSGDSGPAREVYDSSQRQFNMGNWSAARNGFQMLVDQYPNTEYGPLARFRLGQIAVQEERYQEAVSLYQEVREFHPDSPEAPRALFGIGVVYLDHLEDEERGREALQRFVATYSGHELADLARERLSGDGGRPS